MSDATTEATEDKILAVARMYLDVFRDRPDKAQEFLDGLRAKSNWSPLEITALQTRVVDILLGQGRGT